MRTTIICLFICLGISLSGTLFSQSLLTGYSMFSHKKSAFITTTEGQTLEGTVDKVKRKKGLLELVILDINGKKVALKPAEIDHMYLPPSGLDKFSNAYDEATTMSKWDREDVESDKIKDGYAYFENALVSLKGKSRTMLMQLLNPGFSSRLRVYFDPFAAETMRAGIGPVTVAGGLDKSYYVQRPNEEAYRLKKKEYKKDFETFYQDCPELLQKYESPNWPDFAKHIFYYTENCN
ncbi:MAG: hypothetical protein KDC53_19515 [Saprospiraceae bacterium]|nr:hypothetical protein [Saprospiraceae bacterium]